MCILKLNQTLNIQNTSFLPSNLGLIFMKYLVFTDWCGLKTLLIGKNQFMKNQHLISAKSVKHPPKEKEIWKDTSIQFTKG